MKLSKTISKVVVLFFVALIISGCGGAEQRKAKYLERGKDYLEQQNYDKAIVEFKNVLQIDPKTAVGYYYLGRIAEHDQADAPAAVVRNEAVDAFLRRAVIERHDVETADHRGVLSFSVLELPLQRPCQD